MTLLLSDGGTLCGLDLGVKRIGYGVGDGSCCPTAGAWRVPQVGEDLGGLGVWWWRQLEWLVTTHRVEAFTYESPLLRPTDHLDTLRKTYGLGFLLETFCDKRFPCSEVGPQGVKFALTGRRNAEKDDMVAACERLGLSLPPTDADGRKDAADAVGVWAYGMKAVPAARRARWDELIAKSSGALL